jgi:hypothetical protein
VNGRGFINDSVVRWNGSNRTTTFISSNQLTAAIRAADVTTGGTAQVTVFNPAPGGGSSNSQTFIVDGTPPTLVISAPSATLARNGTSVTYTVDYTGADAVTLGTSDVTLNSTGSASGTVNVTGSGTLTRTVIISSLTGDGTLGISITAGTASDLVGNTAAAAEASATFTVDNTAPSLTGFSATTPSASLNIPIPAFTATDSVGVVAYLVTTSTTQPSAGAPGWTGTAPSAYTVASDGTYTLYPWAKDAAGNVSALYGSPVGVVVDMVPPTVTISAPTLSVANSSVSVTYTLTYTGADTIACAAGHVALNNTGTANGSVAVSGTGTTSRTVTISNITGFDGTLGITIAANTASDAAGNMAAGAGPSATFAVDNSSGDFDGDGVDVIDALAALRITAGLDAPTGPDSAHGDVAPLVSGRPQPDGKIDIGDVVVILRKAAGLTTW